MRLNFRRYNNYCLADGLTVPTRTYRKCKNNQPSNHAVLSASRCFPAVYRYASYGRAVLYSEGTSERSTAKSSSERTPLRSSSTLPTFVHPYELRAHLLFRQALSSDVERLAGRLARRTNASTLACAHAWMPRTWKVVLRGHRQRAAV